MTGEAHKNDEDLSEIVTQESPIDTSIEDTGEKDHVTDVNKDPSEIIRQKSLIDPPCEPDKTESDHVSDQSDIDEDPWEEPSDCMPTVSSSALQEICEAAEENCLEPKLDSGQDNVNKSVGSDLKDTKAKNSAATADDTLHDQNGKQFSKSTVDFFSEEAFEKKGDVANFCKLCDLPFDCKRGLRSHNVNIHKDIFYPTEKSKKDSYRCKYCPEVFKTFKLRKSHWRRLHEKRKRPGKVQCPQCPKEVATNYLRHHLTTVHATDKSKNMNAKNAAKATL